VIGRLFVAIWPDAAAIEALQAAVARARAEHPDLRWQPEERWHVTLAFLGQADPDRAAARLDHVLRGDRSPRVPRAEPIRLVGSGTFGPIVWVGVEHGPWLAGLADVAQRALTVADRRFRAHVTVGRARGRPSEATPAARAAARSLVDHDGPAWLPGEVTLVESTAGPKPAYQVLTRWPLGPADQDSPRRGPAE
jgi:2'-5' RNA ligase